MCLVSCIKILLLYYYEVILVMPMLWLRKETKTDIGSTYPLYISVYAKFSVNQSFSFWKQHCVFWQPLPILIKNRWIQRTRREIKINLSYFSSSVSIIINKTRPYRNTLFYLKSLWRKPSEVNIQMKPH